MKKYSLFFATLSALILVACNQTSANRELATEKLHYADSSSFAHLTTAVELPAPGQGKAADQIRKKLLDVLDGQLSHIVQYDRRSFPAYDGDTGNAGKMVAYCHEKAFEAFAKDAEEAHEDYGEMPGYEYEYTVQKTRETDNYVVFNATGYAYLGGAHGGVFGDGPMTFNKSDGSLIAHFLVPSCLNDIQPLIRNGLREYFSEDGQKISNRELNEWLMLESDIIPFPAMSLEPSDEGLVFTYGQYEIAPYVAGMPSFTIPYADIERFLTPEAKAILGGVLHGQAPEQDKGE